MEITEILKAAADILGLLKKSDGGSKRSNVRLASRKLKQLRRQLKKGGFEDWEKELYDDVVKAYAKQLKKLME